MSEPPKRAIAPRPVTEDEVRSTVRGLIGRGLALEGLEVATERDGAGKLVLQGTPDLPAARDLTVMLAEQIGIKPYQAGPGATVMRRRDRRDRKSKRAPEEVASHG